MFPLISRLFGFRQSMGLVVIVVLMASLSHYVPALSSRASMHDENVHEEAYSHGGQRRVVAMARKTAESEPAVDGATERPHDSMMDKEDLFRNLEMDEKGFNWRKDWWKYLCIALVGLLAVFCGIRLVKMVFKLVVFFVCMVAGIIGAFYMGPLLTPILEPHIPSKVLDFISSELVGYAAGFSLAYLAVTIVMALLPRTVHGGGSKGK